MAKVNRLAVVLFLILSIAGGCSRPTPQAKRDRFLEAGKKALEKREYAAAILEFQNASQAMPNDPEPYYHLGLATLATGDLRTGVLYLKKANELDPKHMGAQLKIAELESSTGDRALLDDAESRVKAVLALAPDNAEALNTLAVAAYKLGRPDEAEAHLREALQKAPASLKSYGNLAVVTANRNDPAGAERILKQGTEANPTVAESWLLLGRFYVLMKRLPEAEAQFKKATEVGPKNPSAWMDLGRVQYANGRKEDAEKAFRRVSEFPDAEYRPVHGVFLWEIGNTDAAIAEFSALAKKDPKDRAARSRLVKAYLAAKKANEAERVVTNVLSKNPNDADALIERSEIYLSQGKIKEAVADLNQAVRFKPEDPTAHYLLAQVHRAGNEELPRRQALGEALRLNPRMLRARIELADALIAAKSPGVAVDLMNGAPDDQRTLLPVVAMRNWALMANGDFVEARKGINEAIAKSDSPEFLFQSAWLKLSQRDFAAGRAVLEEVLKKAPGDRRTIEALTNSYFAEGRSSEAVAKLKVYASKQPESSQVQIYTGQILLNAGDRPGARAAFLTAKKATPQLQAADVGLAILDSMEGNLDAARSSLAALTQGPRPNYAAAIQLGNLEQAERKYPAAIKAYRKAMELRPSEWLPINNLAYCLIEDGQLDEALKLSQQAKGLAPENHFVIDTLGWAYYRKGMYDAAVRELEAIKGQRDAVAQYHLAMAYFKRGDDKNGQAVLSSAMKMDSRIPEAKMAQQIASETSAGASRR